MIRKEEGSSKKVTKERNASQYHTGGRKDTAGRGKNTAGRGKNTAGRGKNAAGGGKDTADGRKDTAGRWKATAGGAKDTASRGRATAGRGRDTADGAKAYKAPYAGSGDETRTGVKAKAGNAAKAVKKPAAAARVAWKPGNMLYPVPAVMVSCAREGEKPNIVTIAWAGTICSDPPMLSIAVRPERYSYGIIKETREFVVNLVNEKLLYAMDYCGVKSGRDVDKFKELELTPLPSGKIKAPGIAESPVSIECRVTKSLPLGSHELFLAEVKAVTVDSQYLDGKGKFDLSRAGLAAYSHGEYFALGKKLGTFGYSVKKSGKAPEKGVRDAVHKNKGKEKHYG